MAATRIRRLNTKAKLIMALVLVVGIIGMLIRTAVTKASTYYMTVSELRTEGQAALNQQVTLSGTIVGSSVQWNPGDTTLNFSVRDTKGATTLPVVYHGSRPDDFTNDWPVIVTGELQSDGVFHASQLLIKCPSKYQAQSSSGNSAS